MSGWFRIQRGWHRDPVFKAEPFTEREAFLWLIENAAWKPHNVNADGAMVGLERGQLLASVRTLAAHWRWGQKRVRGFLTRLEAAKMIERNTQNWTHHGAKLTLCDYERYQTGGHVEGRAEGTARTHDIRKKEGKEAYSAAFETFWRTYPRRTTDSKRATARAFERATAEVDGNALIAAVHNYRRHLEQTGKLAYAKGAAAWLNGAMWEGFSKDVVTWSDPVDGRPRRMTPCPL